MTDLKHVTEPLARRLLVHCERPTHRTLTRAYVEAEGRLAKDEREGSLPPDVLEHRAASLLELAPGRTIDERLQGLCGFWGVRRAPSQRRIPYAPPAANDNAARA
jgi:hypothetical protein